MSYKATIITPFHNTDMSMFSRTCESVKNQTIGFENIQWIIVLHNCEQKYIDEVQALLGRYENVWLKELRNDVHSASSPRNYGLQFVASPYIEFLDSDDTINEKTVETCLEKMAEHKAQIIVFRMGYIKQNDKVQALLTDETLWNVLESEIVLTGEAKQRKELYYTFNFTSQCKFFEADFLLKNKLRFDESIAMAEDAYFVLQCYAEAEKILILPNFIGYCYFINSGSTVQSMNKPAKLVLRFAEGFKKMFDLMLESKAYLDYFCVRSLHALLQYAYCSEDFTAEDWQQLQAEMAPYVKQLEPLPGNRINTKEEGEHLYDFVRKGYLTPHGVKSELNLAFLNGEEVLLKILGQNQNTDFARYYDFPSIRSLEDYQKKVPLYTRQQYSKLLELLTSVGDREVVAAEKFRAYAYDLNELDEMQTIPVTEEVYKELGSHFLGEIKGETTFLMMEGMPKGRKLADDAYNDSTISLMVQSAVGSCCVADMHLPGNLTSPLTALFPTSILNLEYVNLLFALRNPEVTQIYASNTWVVFSFLELLGKAYQQLCDDVACGEVSVVDEETKEFSRQFLELQRQNPRRAMDILRAVETLKDKEPEKILKAIWPKLRRIVARSGGAYQLYTRQLSNYLGDIELSSGDFVTPYGIIAKGTETAGEYSLEFGKLFYEFLPADSQKEEEPKLLQDIGLDKIYELLITSNSGIYRLRTGIFIRPQLIERGRVVFAEVKKPVSDAQGYICSGETIFGALYNVLGEELYDYCYFYDEEENNLGVMLEVEKGFDFDKLSVEIEQQLMKNASYSYRRQQGLKPCKAYLLDKETRLLRLDMKRQKYTIPRDCFTAIRNLEAPSTIKKIKEMSRLMQLEYEAK